MARRLYRSRENRIISGVCGGIGEYFDIDPVLIRIIWAITVIVYGIGILAYIIALIAIPLEPKPEKNIEEVGSSENNKREKKNRKSVGGLILIGIGVIFLLHNFNFFPWFDIGKLWPVILIVIGIAMLILDNHRKDKYFERRHLKMRKSLIPGLVLILLGITFLLINLGYLGWNVFFRLFSLWPLILVVIGIELVSISKRFFFLKFLSPLLLIGGFLWAILGATRKKDIKTEISYFSQLIEKNVSKGRIDIDYGAGKLSLIGGTTYFWEGEFEKKPVIKTEIDSFLQKVKIKTREKSFSWSCCSFCFNKRESNNWDIRLTEEIPLEIYIDAGACELDLDMSTLKVKVLDLDIGATEVDMKFSELIPEVTVNIDAGVSSLKINIPEEFGVKVNLDSGLSLHNLKKLGFKEKRESIYYSPNYSNTEKRIELNMSLGVSIFKLKFYQPQRLI